MEAARDFIPFGDDGQGTGPARASGVDVALAALRAAGATAEEEAASWDFRAASDFAGRVEELSRWVEYQQLVAAAAVDRTRTQNTAAAGKAARSWTTGWREETASAAVTAGRNHRTATAAWRPPHNVELRPGLEPADPRSQLC